MSNRYEQHPRFSPAGVITGAILATIVAMVISVAIDFVPLQAKSGTAAATAKFDGLGQNAKSEETASIAKYAPTNGQPQMSHRAFATQ
jgi:hypothetical protein